MQDRADYQNATKEYTKLQGVLDGLSDPNNLTAKDEHGALVLDVPGTASRIQGRMAQLKQQRDSINSKYSKGGSPAAAPAGKNPFR